MATRKINEMLDAQELNAVATSNPEATPEETTNTTQATPPATPPAGHAATLLPPPGNSNAASRWATRVD